MHDNKPGEATQEEALLLLLWGIRQQVKDIDGLLRHLIDELSKEEEQEARR